MFTHVLTVLGAIATLLGAAFTVWPALPKKLAYGLFAIGVVTLAVGIYRIVKEASVAQQEQVEQDTAFVKMKMGRSGYEILDSNAVSSIDDNGVGDISVNFETPVEDKNYFVQVSAAEGSIDYEVISRERNGFRLQFSVNEPALVRISWKR